MSGVRLPPSSPVRVLRAQPSAQTLRETAQVLLVAALPFLSAGGLVLAFAVELWLENRRGSALAQTAFALRLLRMVGVLGGLVGGYGLVCLLRALRLRRRAGRLSRGQDPEVD